jgi:hypothetical protein
MHLIYGAYLVLPFSVFFIMLNRYADGHAVGLALPRGATRRRHVSGKPTAMPSA